MTLKEVLNAHVASKNSDDELFSYADPLQVATKFKEPHIALICALFAYGNAKLIVKFLNSLDFSLLDENEEYIKKNLTNHKYRFQTTEDVKQIFITLSRLKRQGDIEEIFRRGFDKNHAMIDAINEFIKFIYSLNSYRSQGYEFFFSKPFDKSPSSPYKRYNMYLRWMVRDSDIDLGLFKNLNKKDLLLPLDVHTHRISLALGLCTRKSYDFQTVLQITQKLIDFDENDPIKYDFSLYRIGQKSELNEIFSNIR
ncbi:TIGR02757 family protein [Campylobacter californiensis]|uniref:TIGR02757 family protein n=1 Tax=Campylobacter californiensis TaxID=1032243 RepID=A0ABD4JFX6_9BACT|nr:TIGR02757 family protein [Campylobacter sp. RM12916]MBE2985678.1 TIGR02757 family protein [Campylobacter sp. RM12919]MBE2987293.1 TIGR02757 family protein [Campylobacter sp. RM12920]MBE3609165.1 TIGR02757 family protein [Campylobacter sp. RM12916]